MQVPFLKIFGFIISYTSVFGLAMLELWAAVPLGFALKLNPWMNAVLSCSGAITGVAIVIFGGESIRKFIVRVRGESKRQTKTKTKKKHKPNKLAGIWKKYGVIGLGLLAPWITGAPIGAALGMALKAEPKKLLIWLSAGTILCTSILVLIGVAGMGIFKH